MQQKSGFPKYGISAFFSFFQLFLPVFCLCSPTPTRLPFCCMSFITVSIRPGRYSLLNFVF
nr:MAG TPA: hypothetical protein [Caudoviricetes sp.]